MIANLALLLLEVLLLGSTVLVLHRLSPRYGLTLLIAFTIGLTVFVQAANTTLVYVQLSPDFYVVIAATVCIPIILLVVLILYAAEGTVPARLTIFCILGVSALYFLLLLSGKLHLSLAGGGSFVGLTPDSPSISPDLTSTLASLAAFATDLFIIAIVYQGIKNATPRWPAWISPGLALMISLWSDTILYQMLAYGVSSDFLTVIADDLLGKTIIGLVLWPLAALYLTRVAPRLPGFRGVESRPTFDLLFGPSRGIEAALARSEAALHESEEKFRNIFEQSSDSIVLCDEEGRIVAWNRAAEQMTGLTRAETAGQYYWDVQRRLLPEAQSTPAAYERMRSMMKDALQTGQAPWLNRLLEGEIRGPAGQQHYFQQVASPIRTSKGFMMSNITRDITERRQMEVELRSSRARLQGIFDNAAVGIAVTDLNGRYTQVNDAWLRMFGYDHADIDRLTFLDTTAAAYLEESRRRFAALIRGDVRTYRYEKELLRKDGSLFWGDVSTNSIYNPHGQIEATIAVITDITERKRAEVVLRASEALYQSLVETLPISVCRKDLAGRFTFVNQRYCNEIKRPASDILGKTDFDLHPADLAEKYRQDDRAVIAAGQTVEMVEEHARLGGERTYVQAFKSPVFDAAGQASGIQIIFWDVTERQRAEETLQMFQYTIDRASDAVQWLNRDGGFAYVNDQACRSLGYTREELLGLHLWDVDPIYPKERWDANWESYQPNRSGGSEIVETIHRRKDGSVFPVEVLSNHLWFGNRELHVAVVRDITERKQAEQLAQFRLRLMVFAATHSLEELLQQTLDEVGELTSSPIGFYHFVEADQRTLSLQAWSTRTLEEFCQAEGQGLHYPIDQAGVWTDCVRERRPIIHNDYASLPHRKGLPEGHAQVTRELVVPILRGERIVAILGVGNKAQAYTNKDVEIVTYAADLAWEITERKQAEEALRSSEERYRRLVEVSPVAMWINQDGIITYMNPAALRILGATDLQQVVGRAALEFVHPDDHAIVKERISQMLDRGLIVPLLQEKYVRLDGSVVDVEVTATPFSSAGRRAMQVLFQDITERKRAEAERERLIAELENKNAELERFTYTASHDLKSPLVTIRGFLGFLEKDAAAGDLDQLRADIVRIRNAADRMQQLLSELLELSRIGRMMNPPEELPVAAIVQEAVELVQGRIEARGAQIEVQPDLPVVYGDRMRLVEVVQNLIDNACKFMGDQVEPRITIGRRGTDRDGKPIVFVRDNGIGIDPQYQQKVFGLFDKLDSKSEGTGIGLALVKRIVEVHGGRIWVESAGMKTGATFYFTLPVKSDV